MVTTYRPVPVRPAPGAVADHLAPLLALVFSGDPPVRFECWDGSTIGPDDPPATTLLADLAGQSTFHSNLVEIRRFA